MNSLTSIRFNRYVIIENQLGAVAQLRTALEQLDVPQDHIYPPASDGRTIGHTNAENLIDSLKTKGVVARERCVVLFLDIALDDDDRGFDEGIAWLKVFLDATKDYVRILYSGATDQVQAHLGTHQYDGLLSKHRLRLSNDEHWRTGIVRSVMGEAIRKWQNRNPSIPFDKRLDQEYEVEDNLALRMFQATFGKDALTEVVLEATKGVSTSAPPEVKIASGGYSGSHVLLIRFANDIGTRRIAIKLDKRKEELEKEVEKQKEVASAIEKWANVPLALVDGSVKEIPNAGSRMYFFSQPFFSGETLERHASKSRLSATQVKAIEDKLFKLIEAGLNDRREVQIGTCFGLSMEDEMRFSSSASRLAQILPRLTKNTTFRKQFLHNYTNPIEPIRKLVSDWVGDRIKWKFASLPAYEQHGDLNPRNILLLADNDSIQVKFIDFARCGVWPIGYDLQRLRLQLALRLLDSPDSLADQFHDRMFLWERSWSGDKSVLLDIPTNSPQIFGFENFLELSNSISRTWNSCNASVAATDLDRVRYAYKVSQVWDLIKMCSYQDASWFKRLWFMILATKKAREIGLLEHT